MVVALIVRDRSELFLLKKPCADIRQVAYYSVAFNRWRNGSWQGSSVFGSATGDHLRSIWTRYIWLAAITASTFRYLALTSIPLHLFPLRLPFPR